jgi:hypothetical protein
MGAVIAVRWYLVELGSRGCDLSKSNRKARPCTEEGFLLLWWDFGGDCFEGSDSVALLQAIENKFEAIVLLFACLGIAW